MTAPGCAPVVVLTGAPGAGKTTVGRLLGEKLGLGFADTDQMVEESAGKPVAEIFIDSGEPAFREMEEAAVAAALDHHHGVLALGGGAVLSPRTRARLSGAPVVWLVVSASDAASRVGMNTARPLLLGNVRGRLVTLLQEREGLYREVQSLTIDTAGRPPEAIADEIAAWLETRGGDA